MRFFNVCLVAMLAGVGCSHSSSVSSQKSPLPDPPDNFTLYVSNQSFAVSPVDIRIKVDGQLVVDGRFEVGTQHNWKRYVLALGPGKHQIEASSSLGQAELTRDFDVTGKHWAVINYCYYPKEHYMPTPRQFSFMVQDEPILFE